MKVQNSSVQGTYLSKVQRNPSKSEIAFGEITEDQIRKIVRDEARIAVNKEIKQAKEGFYDYTAEITRRIFQGMSRFVRIAIEDLQGIITGRNTKPFRANDETYFNNINDDLLKINSKHGVYAG